MNRSPRVLIVDDELRMAKSIETILFGRGYDVQIMTDPQKALEQINDAKFDLVVLDVKMPQMSGFELLEAFDSQKADTLFIMMTGDASMDSAVKAIRLGASDYLKKPFDPEELIIRVENVLKQVQWKCRKKQIEAENAQLEKQLRQSQKMEAIGTLAGGIAHDFNNILGIMLGNAELAMAEASGIGPILKHLEKIMKAGNRAKDMINQLLSFSRKNDSQRQNNPLNGIICDSLKLLRATIPANIEIRQEVPEKECIVLCDTTEIHQIMINLCTNAAHAIGDARGVISVKLKRIHVKENSLLEYSGLKKGKYVKLVIADTGHGIDPEIINQIFDPYFTTKKSGQGTGMGLAVVHGIVKNHGGEIRVYTKKGEKTEFQVFLPLKTGRLDAVKKSSIKEMPKGAERILLVDDEEMIVDMTGHMLRQLGYQVNGQTESLKALEIFRENPSEFDLILTDLTMPYLSGHRLAEKIKAIRAEIPIILCTGFNEPLNKDKQLLDLLQAVIMKPIGMNKLAKTLRKVLDEHKLERRRERRYRIKESTFVESKSKPFKRGKVIDISPSGFSFKYAQNGDQPEAFDQLSIKTLDDSFAMENVRYKTASDIETDRQSHALPVSIRRSGGRFVRLSQRQNEQLTYFIKNFTRK